MGGCAAGRITPARAGKSAMWTPTTKCPLDHPRACGEECTSSITCSTTIGSPPRVRGREVLEVCTASRPRITPARAGKSSGFSPRGERSRDHPRACGEEALQTKVLAGATDHPRACGEEWVTVPGPISYSGSPPRVRGRESLVFSRQLVNGITPRACGEERKVNPPVGKKKGSPPRVRGRGPTGLPLMTPGGITPARAGKSSSTLVTKFCA